jgi:hypothetical protein
MNLLAMDFSIFIFFCSLVGHGKAWVLKCSPWFGECCPQATTYTITDWNCPESLSNPSPHNLDAGMEARPKRQLQADMPCLGEFITSS